MNELEKRAKYHWRKRDGLSPFCSMGEDMTEDKAPDVKKDAGDVEHNIEVFNSMNTPVDGPSTNPTGGPMGEDINNTVIRKPSKITEVMDYDDDFYDLSDFDIDDNEVRRLNTLYKGSHN